MQVYSENIALIMAGRNPVTRNDMLEADSLSAKKGATVAAIAEDSLLRAQMETPGSPYSLYDPDAARKNLRSAMELFAPVKGVVTARFSPIDNRFGVSLATTSNQQVMAVMDGTVISAPWTPEDGFVLYVQHANNMISVYRHNVSVLKKAGDRVSSGEIIGYTGGENAPGQDKNMFEFELWHNGTLSTRRDISFSELPEPAKTRHPADNAYRPETNYDTQENSGWRFSAPPDRSAPRPSISSAGTATCSK